MSSIIQRNNLKQNLKTRLFVKSYITLYNFVNGVIDMQIPLRNIKISNYHSLLN